VLSRALRHPWIVVGSAAGLVIGAGWLATRMGAEFIPDLDEGDLAAEVVRVPSAGLALGVVLQEALERALLEHEEVETVFTRLGTAEVATDPSPPARGDMYIMLKPRSAWPDPRKPKAALIDELERSAATVPGGLAAFSQPIKLRFDELIAGVKAEVAIKIFGDDLDTLLQLGGRTAALVQSVPGAADVRVEQLTGLAMLTISVDRAAASRLGLNVRNVQDVVDVALGGKQVGQIFEGDRRFDLVVRLPERLRGDQHVTERLPIPLSDGGYVPLSEIATISVASGPNAVNRENGKRRAVVTANVRGRDLASFIASVQTTLRDRLQLPAGYWIRFGGTFEQLESAVTRLRILVPVTLLMIFGLLLLTFGSAKDAVLVFSGVPLALTGGVAALWLRGIPLSISAGVGFITLSGVAVLTGVVMVSAFREPRDLGKDVRESIVEGALLRLRPVLMIALVAALGFLPMALNTGTGAEVQRPLATVVIGGIVSATLLSLLVHPVLYAMTARQGTRGDSPTHGIGT